MMALEQGSFDPDFASPQEWAAMYRACGLQVVPSYTPGATPQWKRPMVEWAALQNEIVPDFTFERWYGQAGEFHRHRNMGFLTGRCSRNIFVIDLDTYKAIDPRAWWKALLAEHNYGRDLETWRQITGGGGEQLLFEAPPGWTAPTNRTSIGVDIRGQGGFAVLPPSLHSSGKEYEWAPGCAPWETELEAAPDWLLEAVERLVAERGGSDTRHGPVERVASSGDFSPFGRQTDGREEKMRDWVWASLLGLYRLTDGVLDEEAMKATFQASLEGWLRYAGTRLDEADHIAGLEREGRGPSAFLEKWQRAMRHWNGKLAEEAGRPEPRPFKETGGEIPTVSGDSRDAEPVKLLPYEPAFPIDGAALPRRDWILFGFLLCRHMTVLVAPPGSGKSLFTLQVSIAVAVGRTWAGWTVRKSTRVLVINAEDDHDEMRRRLWAAAREMGVDQADLADRLFLASAPESIVVAKIDSRSKAVVRTPLVEQLVATVLANDIGLIVVDPFAETFEGDENSNSEVKWAGIIWREVARRTGCALLLVHHTKKYANGMAGDADASRGGGALIGTARIVSTLFGMTEEEATAMAVPPELRTSYVRFDDAKANMGLVTGMARWFEKRSVDIPNGTISQPGDSVGVLIPWTPPGPFTGTDIGQLNRILDVIARGLLDDNGAPSGDLYSPNKQAKKRWVGIPIMQMLACDETRATNVAKEWLKTGLLYDESFVTTNGDTRSGLRVEAAKRPGTSL